MTPEERAVIEAARAERRTLGNRLSDTALGRAVDALELSRLTTYDARAFVHAAIEMDPRAGFLAKRLLDFTPGHPTTNDGQWGKFRTVRDLANAPLRDLMAIRNVGTKTLAVLVLALESVGATAQWAAWLPPKYERALTAARKEHER